jgi:LysM repeat protein
MKSWPTYQVQKGDTLYSIARRTHSVPWQLMQANCLPNEYVYVGQLLFVPILPITTQAPAPGPIPTDNPSITPTNTESIDLKFSPNPPPLFQITN